MNSFLDTASGYDDEEDESPLEEENGASLKMRANAITATLPTRKSRYAANAHMRE